MVALIKKEVMATIKFTFLLLETLIDRLVL